MKDNDEIEQIEKIQFKNVTIVYNSLWVPLCVFVFVCAGVCLRIILYGRMRDV